MAESFPHRSSLGAPPTALRRRSSVKKWKGSLEINAKSETSPRHSESDILGLATIDALVEKKEKSDPSLRSPVKLGVSRDRNNMKNSLNPKITHRHSESDILGLGVEVSNGSTKPTTLSTVNEMNASSKPDPVKKHPPLHGKSRSRASIIFEQILEEKKVKVQQKKKKEFYHGRSVTSTADTTGSALKQASNEVVGQKSGIMHKSKIDNRHQRSRTVAAANAHDKPKLPPLPPTQDKIPGVTDLLAEMKQGSAFLKYGNRGFPHFRHVQLSQNHRKIQWFSKAKKLSDSEIDFSQIIEVRKGQTTAKFKRHPAPSLERSSLSIMYLTKKGKKDSLDIIAKDPRSYQIWILGLSRLRKICAENGVDYLETNLENLPTTLIEKGLVSPRNKKTDSKKMLEKAAENRLSDADFDDHVEDVEDNGLNSFSSYKGGKGHFSSTVQIGSRKDVKKIDALQTKATQYKVKLEKVKEKDPPKYENMKAILKRAIHSLELARDAHESGEQDTVDHETWKAGVELEALHHAI
eukprot:jgi/Bigna1/127576/aug1.4_g2284